MWIPVLMLLTTFAVEASADDILKTFTKHQINVVGSGTGTTGSPVVGILSQPRTNPDNDNDNDNNNSTEYYIAASYVKWLESAGARSIPIPYDAPPTLVRDIFTQVNGVLFPGGNSPLPNSAKVLWQLAMKANQEEHDYFPIWGTCLGFEYMLMLAAHAKESVLQSGFDAENVSLPLLFTENSASPSGLRRGRLSRRTMSSSSSPPPPPPPPLLASHDHTKNLYDSPKIRHIVSTQNVTMNNHMNGIEPTSFRRDAGLTTMFHVTTTNYDRQGRPFVSTIEPNDPHRHPFYGVQFHPEKNNFEYATYPGTDIPYEAINHSDDAIEVSLYLARFFVSQVRINAAAADAVAHADADADAASATAPLGESANHEKQNLRKGTNQKQVKNKRTHHTYTKADLYPLVYTYEMKTGLDFEQVYIIPSADHWQEEEEEVMQHV